MRGTLIAFRRGDGVSLSVIGLTADFVQEGDQWVGTVLELGISTDADTLDAVRDELAELVVLHLNEVERLGFLEEYLKEHGVRQELLPKEKTDERSDRWNLITVGA